MYICDFSRSVGAGSATTRKTRGLTRSTMRLIVPPLPAVSRPSNTMQTLAPVRLDPLLHGHQLGLERRQLGLVLLAAESWRRGRGSSGLLAHGWPPITSRTGGPAPVGVSYASPCRDPPHRMIRARVSRRVAHSHSIVPGGLEVMSTVTRLTSRTSLVMRVEIVSSTS